VGYNIVNMAEVSLEKIGSILDQTKKESDRFATNLFYNPSYQSHLLHLQSHILDTFESIKDNITVPINDLSYCFDKPQVRLNQILNVYRRINFLKPSEISLFQECIFEFMKDTEKYGVIENRTIERLKNKLKTNGMDISIINNNVNWKYFSDEETTPFKYNEQITDIGSLCVKLSKKTKPLEISNIESILTIIIEFLKSNHIEIHKNDPIV
jgi:hypothetical protein